MVLTKPQREAAKEILTQLDGFKTGNRFLADVFQELPPKKVLPDYYQVIARPMALDIVRSRAKNGKYANFKDFLRDLAQIFYNAKLYNLKKSLIYTDAVALEELLNKQVSKLKKAGVCADNKLPEIGAVPEGSDDDSDAAPMIDVASSDNDDAATAAAQTPVSKKLKISLKAEPSTPSGEDGRTSPGASKKRGRPPRVETPDEGRMKNVLRAIRKVQRDGQTLFEPFEKLPDAKEYPDYYKYIKNPMSLALVKKNVKRKVYANTGMEAFLRDVKTIFANAQIYNEDGSTIHEDATYLLKHLDELVKNEVARPDVEFLNVDTQDKFSNQSGSMVKLVRKGVSEILQRGESYRVGDWVYLENPNDAANPIIAQIFRTWQNSDGQYWVNVCWYYRPHQTVHRADKLWYEREVVKTGQYRDHAAQEVIGHCYVMYVTKYVRGRPKEYTGKEEDLYVCENRYNEDLKTYNKIKAWKSCVPEESREQSSNYEMHLYPDVRPAKKFVSPLLYMMPEDKTLWVTPVDDPENPVKAPEPRDRGATSAPPKEGNIVVTAVPDERALAEMNGELKQETRPPVIAPIPQKPAAAPLAVASPQVQNQPGQMTPAQIRVQQTNYIQTPGQNGGPIQSPYGTGQQPHVGQTPSHPYMQTPAARPNTASMYQSVQGTPRTPGIHTNVQMPNPMSRLASQQRPMARPSPASAPILPPAPANTNKLNSLGSQINPTSLVFLNSLGMGEEVKSHFLTDEKGELIWFTVPPQDSVRPEQKGRVQSHSARWLAWRLKKRKAAEMTTTSADGDDDDQMQI